LKYLFKSLRRPKKTKMEPMLGFAPRRLAINFIGLEDVGMALIVC
jgi:hypothetical protein